MAYGFGMYGNIFVNLKGREPLGIVCREDYEKVRRAIQDQLIDLRDPNSGERLIDRIYRREDLYSGLYVEDAPDLILRWKDYSYYTAVTPGREKGSIFGDFLRIDSSDFEHLGTHRLDGIFVAAGKGIPENTTIEGARIEDLAPTLVFSLHQPVPQDMDGRVLPHLFTAEHLEGREPEYVYFDTTSQDISKKGEYSDSESKKVEERLKGLGYM